MRGHHANSCWMLGCRSWYRSGRAVFQWLSLKVWAVWLRGLSGAPWKQSDGAIWLGPRPLIHPEGETQFVSSESISEILEEVAPVAARGKQISGNGGFQSSCAVDSISDYENPTISPVTSACRAASSDRNSGAQIIFKRDACAFLKNPFRAVQPMAR